MHYGTEAVDFVEGPERFLEAVSGRVEQLDGSEADPQQYLDGDRTTVLMLRAPAADAGGSRFERLRGHRCRLRSPGVPSPVTSGTTCNGAATGAFHEVGGPPAGNRRNATASCAFIASLGPRKRGKKPPVDRVRPGLRR